jgi:hypothetical protein
MEITLRDGSTVRDPRFGRIAVDNPAALAKYPIAAVLDATQQKPVSKTWTIGPRLDQGRQGACVGYGWTAELMAKPYAVRGAGQATAVPLYFECQRTDQFPGGEYPDAAPNMSGTTVEAGAQVLTAAAHYLEYRWARTERDIALAVGHKGPIVIGVGWYEGMEDPGPDGFIRKTGELLGGHCVLVYGFNARAGFYKIQNSWGADWGIDGTCYLTRDDMAALLADDGEACLPVRARKFTYAGPTA